MIFDRLENADRYESACPGLCRVLLHAAALTPDNFQTGRLDVEGDRLYINRAEYDTHPREGALTEAHRLYADVMVMVEGRELVLVKSTKALQNVTQPYDEKIDALLSETDADTSAVLLTKGSFLVLFPDDAHAPGCHAEAPAHVKKAIAKVRLA